MFYNKKGVTLIELGIYVAIVSVILGYGFDYGFQYYQKVKERSAIEQVDRVIKDFDVSNFTGRGINKERIKSQVLLFRDNSSIIDIYYYREFFEDLGDGRKDPIPTTEFYGMERLDLSEYEVIFDFDEGNVNGSGLIQDTNTNDYVVGLRRELPHNDMTLFDASSITFKYINPSDGVIKTSYDKYGKGIVDIYQSVSGDPDDVGIGGGTVLSNLGIIEIDALYKKNKDYIGRITLDTIRKKIYFTNKYEETGAE